MKAAAPLLVLLVLAAGPAAAEPEPLGRLFLTPQQRQALDRQRLRAPSIGSEGGLTVNGEVRSSSGGRTRWVNGQADWRGTAPPPRLPVGDSIDPATGEHQPLLGGGRIAVPPPRP
ncbi:MAG TPA: hypothetical protein VF096_08175 [Azonexus sp.]